LLDLEIILSVSLNC